MQRLGVQTIAGASYERIDDEGLHIVVDGVPRAATEALIACAGACQLFVLLEAFDAKRATGNQKTTVIDAFRFDWIGNEPNGLLADNWFKGGKVRITRLEAKRKLNQHHAAPDRAGAIRGLEAQGQHGLAQAMRATGPT